MRIDSAIQNDIARIESSQNVIELRKNLNHMISQLQKAMDKNVEDVCAAAHIAQKRIRRCSKTMGNEMVFVCGEYFEKIENMIEAHRRRIHDESVCEVMSAQISQAIARYLWKNQCSLREAVGCHIGINRDRFDVCMDSLIELGIVRQDIGPEYEWVELSAEGYTYMRKHYYEREGFNLW